MSHKLYFRHGTMNSSKTMNLLMTAHNYERQDKNVIVIKPLLDDRFGLDLIKSRTGIQRTADIILDKKDKLSSKDWKEIHCVLVDEAQFLTPDQIDELRVLTIKCPVICYGLRTDFTGHLFPGSKRLLELADSIEEIKTTCTFCNKKSIINLKYKNGKIIKKGDPIDIGAEEKYKASCWHCWYTK